MYIKQRSWTRLDVWVRRDRMLYKRATVRDYFSTESSWSWNLLCRLKIVEAQFLFQHNLIVSSSDKYLSSCMSCTWHVAGQGPKWLPGWKTREVIPTIEAMLPIHKSDLATIWPGWPLVGQSYGQEGQKSSATACAVGMETKPWLWWKQWVWKDHGVLRNGLGRRSERGTEHQHCVHRWARCPSGCKRMHQSSGYQHVRQGRPWNQQ